MKTPGLYDQLCITATLRRAWERVEESDGCAGVDGVSLDHFARNLEDQLALLRGDLLARTYSPLPLMSFKVPRQDAGERTLNVPAVRDRVAQHALIDVAGHLFEREFENCSFAYRRGRSVDQALAIVEMRREEGYEWVLDADIRAFFDNVDHDLMMSRVAELIPEAEICNLIRGWIAARVYDGEKIIPMEKGLPQGAPISPMLANLYLDRFDEQITGAGYKLVRFADDFLILCNSRPKAEAALRLTADILTKLKLALSEEKTRITSFADGFKFLGASFVRSLCLKPPPRRKAKETSPVTIPPPLPVLRGGRAEKFNPALGDALQEALLKVSESEVPSYFQSRRSEPSPASEDDTMDQPTPEDALTPSLLTLRTLYIHEHGALIRCEDDHLEILRDGVELLSIPAFKLDQIIVFGNSQITTPAMKFCMRNNIPIVLLSAQGNFSGTIESQGNQNVLLHRLQFMRAEEEQFVLETARAIVSGKIANCRSLLQRRHRTTADERLSAAIEGMGAMKLALETAASIEEVRGLEGAAARHYYNGLAACFKEPFRFERRTRRPPLDPVNAMLSFGYSLLFYNIYAIVRARGLLPYVGTLHDLRQGHPALCSDLIEEFRAPVIDSMVTAMVNRGAMSPGDFYYNKAGEKGEAEGGCFMTDGARRRYIENFEQRVNTVVQHPIAKVKTTWRGCIDLQVSLYIKALRGEVERYIPMEKR